jgi:hypothetical protein
LILRLASYGFSLTREELNASYAIIRHNIRTYCSVGVVEVVKSKQPAESTLQKLETWQNSSGHFEGWRSSSRKPIKSRKQPRRSYPAATKGIGSTGIKSDAGNEDLGHPS